MDVTTNKASIKTTIKNVFVLAVIGLAAIAWRISKGKR